MLLVDLCDALGLPHEPSFAGVEVTGVTHNSSWVTPGDLFVALRGANVDGHDFLPQALERGAVAVMGEGLPDGGGCSVPYITVAHGREALADSAAEVAGNPSRQIGVVGVTGTDGKTTTSWMARHLLRSVGEPTGFLSTVGYELPDGVLRQFPAHFTTPEAPQVQSFLAELVEAGAQAAVIEASSHALALDRVRAVDWDVALWTHLTSEHLDFHGTVERYFADKRKLVERAKHAVLNLDDPWSAQLRGIAPTETTYSADGDSNADWWAEGIAEGPRGIEFTLHSPLGTAQLTVPMIGTFNVANALGALAATAHLSGAALPELVAGLAALPGVPGRMEMVGRPDRPRTRSGAPWTSAGGVVVDHDAPGIAPSSALPSPAPAASSPAHAAGQDAPASDIRVIVDFAHTPPSLEKALTTVRTTTEGKLWVLLGSAGGPRDPYKRAPLGEVASRLADWAVFTEEDHRYTPIWDILHEMERGAREGAAASGREPNWISIPDRREAIRYAIREAQPGDTVVLAGKGPEETLERDTETIDWNEVEEAREAIALREGSRG